MNKKLSITGTSTKFILIACLALSILLPAGIQPAQAATNAKYIILFQGDGMASQHIKAGGMYVNGAPGTLVFESFTNAATMAHNNVTGGTTDSAASATAMATGVKVNNGVISVRLPGDGSELTSLLELRRGQGRSTGLVTTSFMMDATPAAHGAHNTSRNNTSDIFNDYMLQTQPNVILGGGGNGYNAATAASQGYTVVSDRAALLALNTESQVKVAGGFGSGAIPADGMAGRSATLPTLPEMTETALKVLDNDPDGFYALIEHEGIDEYSHGNNAEGLVKSMLELNAAVQKAIDWVNTPGDGADWSNTLILVVGDHETGGLLVTETSPATGKIPAVTWSTTGHTQTPVAVYAQGSGAEQFTGLQIDNTNIFSFLSPGVNPPVAPSSLIATPVSTSQIDLAWVDNASNESGFQIERSLDGASWVQIATVGANVTSYASAGLSANTAYYYQVRATNSGGTSTYSNITSATTFASPMSHVGDLDGSRTLNKKNWSASVTITVHDASDNIVSGVTVTGNWSAGASGSASCTTNASGWCTVSKSNLKINVSSVTYSVSNLTKTGWVYSSSANHDVDGGSNGTTIKVLK
jgi:alkaline phosphatase